MIETVFAILTVGACCLLLLRLGIGERRRARWDATCSRGWRALRTRSLALWHWRSTRREAARATEAALQRARQGVHSDGNVIRPDAFRAPRKPH